MSTYAVTYSAGPMRIDACEMPDLYRGGEMQNGPSVRAPGTVEESLPKDEPLRHVEPISARRAGQARSIAVNAREFYAENDRQRAEKDRQTRAYTAGLIAALRNEPETNPCVPAYQESWAIGYRDGRARREQLAAQGAA